MIMMMIDGIIHRFFRYMEVMEDYNFIKFLIISSKIDPILKVDLKIMIVIIKINKIKRLLKLRRIVVNAIEVKINIFSKL